MTLSLLNSFPLYKLLHEELLVPRPLPWRFKFSSMEILVPSGNLVLSFVVRSLPSSIQIPPWITYRWDWTLNRFLFKTLLAGLGDKCTFGVPSGKLVRYMVSRHGIDPNLEKVSAITKMMLPESLYDVQKLTGCMAALTRFISWLDVRGFPFFMLLKK
jgi:hypothetical protein